MVITNLRWSFFLMSVATTLAVSSCWSNCKKPFLDDPLCISQPYDAGTVEADPDVSAIESHDDAGTAESGVFIIREPDAGEFQITERFDHNGDGREDKCWFQASNAPELWHRRDFNVNIANPIFCFGHPITDVRVEWYDPELDDIYRDHCPAGREIYHGLPGLFRLAIRGNNPGYHVGRLVIKNTHTGEVVGGDQVAYTLGAGDSAPPEKLGFLNGRTLSPEEVGAYIHELVAANIVNIGLVGACVIGVGCVAAPLAFLSILESAVELSPALTREEKDARLILINDIRFGQAVLGVYSAVGKIDIARIQKYASTLDGPASFGRLITVLRANAEPILRAGGGVYQAIDAARRMPPGRLAFAVDARLDHCSPGTCCDPGERTVLDDLYLVALGRAYPCREGSAVCGKNGNTVVRCDSGFAVREPCRNCDCDGFDYRDCSCEPPPDPRPMDRDGDGVSADEGDCDDADARRYPGAREVCDGVDNDCDGETDGFVELGVIWCDECGGRVSYPRCVDGHEHICVSPRDCGGGAREVCDGRDNDGDGWVDEDLGTTTCGIGDCRRTIPICSGGRIQTCVPGAPEVERCDSRDDDCDGAVDEGGVCDGGGGGSPEICDGRDNDLDGRIDEDLGTTTCGLGVCQRTVDNCIGGVPQTCVPGAGWGETCGDSIDQDCDGVDTPCPRCELTPCDTPGVYRCHYGDFGMPQQCGADRCWRNLAGWQCGFMEVDGCAGACSCQFVGGVPGCVCHDPPCRTAGTSCADANTLRECRPGNICNAFQTPCASGCVCDAVGCRCR